MRKLRKLRKLKKWGKWKNWENWRNEETEEIEEIEKIEKIEEIENLDLFSSLPIDVQTLLFTQLFHFISQISNCDEHIIFIFFYQEN
jgi:hypothetical protein